MGERFVVVIVTAVDVYQSGLLRGMRRRLADAGVGLVAHLDDPQIPGLPESLQCILRHNTPSGVITTNCLSEVEELAMLRLLDSLGIPVVHIAQDLPGASCVRGDNVMGMALLMKHLLDGVGVRRPVLVRGLSHQPDHVERERVFRRELARRGIPFDEDLLIVGESDRDITYRETARLLRRHRDMDAVVTTDDWCALGAMRALTDAGLRVPEDVAVTGFDNYPLASLTWPGLTSVDQNLERQGATAAELLLARMDGAPPAGTHLVPCRLVVRGSTVVTSPEDPEAVSRAVTMARTGHANLTVNRGVLELSRELIHCRDLDQVSQALASRLAGLGLTRCFLVAYEHSSATIMADGVRHRHARLVLDYGAGGANPADTDPFMSCQILPARQRAESFNGFLVYLPLTVLDRQLGYLLFEPDLGPVPVSETLRMDLSRTLDTVFSTQEMRTHASTLEQLVVRRTQDLERANGELQRMALLDGLTRIANRSAFQAHLQEHWVERADADNPLALLMIDIDLFKSYNDRYGHLAGDEALRKVAALLDLSTHGAQDLACRFGGEEFAVVLPGTGLSGAQAVATRFRRSLDEAAIPHEESFVAPVVTVSIGIAISEPRDDGDPADLIRAADNALYQAKSLGRNRVALYR